MPDRNDVFFTIMAYKYQATIPAMLYHTGRDIYGVSLDPSNDAEYELSPVCHTECLIDEESMRKLNLPSLRMNFVIWRKGPFGSCHEKIAESKNIHINYQVGSAWYESIEILSGCSWR